MKLLKRVTNKNVITLHCVFPNNSETNLHILSHNLPISVKDFPLQLRLVSFASIGFVAVLPMETLTNLHEQEVILVSLTADHFLRPSVLFLGLF